MSPLKTLPILGACTTLISWGAQAQSQQAFLCAEEGVVGFDQNAKNGPFTPKIFNKRRFIMTFTGEYAKFHFMNSNMLENFMCTIPFLEENTSYYCTGDFKSLSFNRQTLNFSISTQYGAVQLTRKNQKGPNDSIAISYGSCVPF